MTDKKHSDTGPIPSFDPPAQDDGLWEEEAAEPQPLAPEEGAANDWVPDLEAIQKAGGDPHAWAHLLYELVGHITGQWIDETSLQGWLEAYAKQVADRTYRLALFEVANTVLPPHVDGDPAILLLTFRDELAKSFKRSANL